MVFPPPQLRTMDVVAILPDRLRRDRASEWADRVLHGAAADSFLEGPVFEADGSLLMVDIPFGRILRLAPEREWSIVAEYDGWPNGMKIGPGGDLLVADHKLGLVRIRRRDGHVDILAGGFRGEPFHGANDLTLAENGDIFFTDQGISGLEAPFGRVFRYRAGEDLKLVMDGVASPNGLVLSKDQRTLFLAVTRANAIWRLPLRDDGSTVKAGLFLQLSGGIGPDGLAIDHRNARLLIAHPGLGVWVFDEAGRPQSLFALEGYDYTTNLAAHPTDDGAYFVTESRAGAVLRLRLEGTQLEGVGG